MELTLSFLAITILSGGFGYIVFVLARKVRSRIATFAIYAFSGTFVLVASGLFFLSRGLALTFSDSSIFEERYRYSISINSDNSPISDDLVLEITFPETVKVHSDAAIDVSVHAPSTPAARKVDSILSSNTETEIRTINNCGSKLEDSGKNAIKACGTLSEIGSSVSLRWFITRKNPGTSLVSISLPDQFNQYQSEISSEWKSKIKRNGRLVTDYYNQDGSRWEFGRDRTNIQELPVILSQYEPVFQDASIEIDLKRKYLTFPIQFTTTVGVSQTLYFYLALIGMFVSTMLGGGWVWKFLEWRRSRLPVMPNKRVN